jgi:hypothetical protein
MKKTMKRRTFVYPAAVLLIAMAVFSGCTSIQIGGELVLKGDGSGSRKYTMYLFNSTNGDGHGNAYNYSKVHGDELRAKVEEKLKANLADSSWLTVSISAGTGVAGNGKQAPAELITLAFNFSSFDDYVNKVTQLARFGKDRLPQGSKFVPPVLQNVRTDLARYREPADTTLWTIRPLFLAMFDDPDVFDFTSKGENTKAELKDLREYGVEMKSVEIKLALGSNNPKTVISGTDIVEQFRR